MKISILNEPSFEIFTCTALRSVWNPSHDKASSHCSRMSRADIMNVYTSDLIKEYHIAGNFQGRKLSQILQFCGYSQKFSLRNLGAWHPWRGTSRAICESFLLENRSFHQFAKVFSLESFPPYSRSYKNGTSSSYALPLAYYHCFSRKQCSVRGCGSMKVENMRFSSRGLAFISMQKLHLPLYSSKSTTMNIPWVM